jgi:DNA-binding transcriptional LysR family regulator
MELRHLRYFVAVAEEENVSRAALKLHVSQPALSRQIRDLEEELGFLLLERSAKSVRLTDAGRAFVAGARRVLQTADDAVQRAKETALGGEVELHAGYAPSLTARILPLILRAFQEELPKVRVRLHDLSTEEMFAGLREGKLQVAFVVKPEGKRMRGLSFEALTREPMCVAVGPRHEWAKRTTVALAEIAQQPLVAYSRADYPEAHEHLIAMFATVKAKPRIAEEHDSVSSLITAVEAGTGVAVVLESLTCTAGLRLRVIPISPPPPAVVVGIAWCRGKGGNWTTAFVRCSKRAVETG